MRAWSHSKLVIQLLHAFVTTIHSLQPHKAPHSPLPVQGKVLLQQFVYQEYDVPHHEDAEPPTRGGNNSWYELRLENIQLVRGIV